MNTTNQFIAFHAIASFFGRESVGKYYEYTLMPQDHLQKIFNDSDDDSDQSMTFLKFYCESWGVECEIEDEIVTCDLCGDDYPEIENETCDNCVGHENLCKDCVVREKKTLCMDCHYLENPEDDPFFIGPINNLI